MAKADLTAQRLRDLLHYDHETGIFTRLVQTSNSVRVGEKAGSLMKIGYVEFGLLGERFLAHRLAWLYMTGEWPPEDIDHIDGFPTNNRFSNLRSVSRSINMQNRKRACRRKHDLPLGVSRNNGDGRYLARLTLSGKSTYHGSFDTPEEAHQRYLEVKRLLHPGNTL